MRWLHGSGSQRSGGSLRCYAPLFCFIVIVWYLFINHWSCARVRAVGCGGRAHRLCRSEAWYGYKIVTIVTCCGLGWLGGLRRDGACDGNVVDGLELGREKGERKPYKTTLMDILCEAD